MTDQEFQALIAILARCPLTAAEALWLQALLDRLAKVDKAVDVKDSKSDDKHRSG